VAGQTIGFGILLIILGVWSYADAETKSFTALIPAFVGLPLALLGALAYWKDHLRKHAMHAAAGVGLLGVLAAVGNVIRVVAQGKELKGPAVNTTVLMGLICGVFLGMCINSFIQARRSQAKSKAEQNN
jgi:uncharacterized membrane protein